MGEAAFHQKHSGVARSLLLGGKGGAQRSDMGVQGLAPGKMLGGGTALKCSENEGNALLSYILHHKHDYIEHKIGRMF